ncbi:MAG: ComEA family DNA-binding protein [Bradymonadaceae bacterium]
MPVPAGDSPDESAPGSAASTAGDTDPPPTSSAGRTPPPDDQSGAPSDSEGELRGVVNLNRASIDELRRLPGIGPALSRRIADYRERRAFEERDDIVRIDGIGPETYESIAPYLAVTGRTRLTTR